MQAWHMLHVVIFVSQKNAKPFNPELAGAGNPPVPQPSLELDHRSKQQRAQGAANAVRSTLVGV